MYILLNDRQLELIQSYVLNKKHFELSEQNDKKNNLIIESHWYNTVMDIAGIFDPSGAIDAVNGVSYISQGEYLFGFLSFVSVIPYIGDAAAKPIMGMIKVGVPSIKALEEALKLSKLGKTAEAAKLLEDATKLKGGGFVSKLIGLVQKFSGKLLEILEKIPFFGKNLKNLIKEWTELLSNVAKKSVKNKASARFLAKNLPKLSKEAQISGLKKLIDASKEALAPIRSYKKAPRKDIFSILSNFFIRKTDGARLVRRTMRETKWYLGLLNHIGIFNKVEPEELVNKFGENGLQSKITEYQNTPQAKQYFQDDYGNFEEDSNDQNNNNQTYTQKSSDQNVDPFSTFFQTALS